MKIFLFLMLIICVSDLSIGQTDHPAKLNTDPFCRMIGTLYSMDSLSFNSQFIQKQVFESDTVSSFAKVNVKKNGTVISFLRIIPEEGVDELLFCNDSAWGVDHRKKALVCLGTDIDILTHNQLSQFFPFSIYNIDTTICQVEPFWKIINSMKDYTVISLDISAASDDISNIRVEFTVGNSDFLPYKTLQESVYLKADKLFQEQVFSGYSIPDPDEVRIPEYFTTYDKDFSLVKKADSEETEQPDEYPGEIYLRDIELFDLALNPFNLPEDGLIFYDLWYVGCPPCMKSAPIIEKLYNEYKDKVYFFSINETDKDTAKINRFKEKMGITFPVLLGAKEKLSVKINERGVYPVFIIVDAESGKVLWKLEGYTQNLEDLIKNAILQNL